MEKDVTLCRNIHEIMRRIDWNWNTEYKVKRDVNRLMRMGKKHVSLFLSLKCPSESILPIKYTK